MSLVRTSKIIEICGGINVNKALVQIKMFTTLCTAAGPPPKKIISCREIEMREKEKEKKTKRDKKQKKDKSGFCCKKGAGSEFELEPNLQLH